MNILKSILYIIISSSVLLSCNGPDQSDNISEKETSKQSGEWISLFNGTNLNGWEVKSVKEDAHLNFWSVENGAIIVNSMGNPNHDYSWLMTKEEYADFELKLKFQSYRDSPGNSGIQIRSRYDDLGMVNGSELIGWLDGPQIDIHPPDPWRIGFIYDETRGHQRWINPNLPDWNIDKEKYSPDTVIHYYSDEAPGWNDLHIICKGNQIMTIFNGNVVSDYDGMGILDDQHHQKYGIDKKGFIALQLHKNDELKIAFKDIMIKIL